MPIAANRTEQHFLLNGLDWSSYDALLEALGDRRVFITYDKGKVEIMSPSWEHETRAKTIGQVIRIMAEELEIPIRGGGSTTFRREDLDRGLEADKCFYIANEARVRGRKQIDLTVDPPPDLCIEVQISRRIADRKEIYADLKVPELWCDDGKQLRVLLLQASGNYKQSSRSFSFPMVPLKKIAQFLELGGTMDDTTWSRRVRKWISENFSKS